MHTYVSVLLETEIQLPDNNAVRIRSFVSVSKHGNVHPPALFFEGVTFGITNANSHNLEVSDRNISWLIDFIVNVSWLILLLVHCAEHTKCG